MQSDGKCKTKITTQPSPNQALNSTMLFQVPIKSSNGNNESMTKGT